MRVYTTLNTREVSETLNSVKAAGLVGMNVYLLEFNDYPRIRRQDGSYRKNVNLNYINRYSIRLGSWDQSGIPEYSCDRQGKHHNLRRSWNTGYSGGYYGDEHYYSATWDEWGWFLAYLFAQHGDAKCGSYRNRGHFDDETHGAYRIATGRVGDDVHIQPLYTETVRKPATHPSVRCTCVINNASGGITTSVMNCAYHNTTSKRDQAIAKKS